MTLFHLLSEASILALCSLVVCLLPLAVAILYVVRPTEQRLALMRPVSLSAIFAGLCSLLAGMINILRNLGATSSPISIQPVAIGLSEAMVPPFVGFGCLTVAWLLVVLGLRRQSWGAR
jgi:biopolymer transport protein ExbB/TolQ